METHFTKKVQFLGTEIGRGGRKLLTNNFIEVSDLVPVATRNHI